jgi:iron complex transport system substrate-binding protein
MEVRQSTNFRQRIVSLAPSATSILCEIGARTLLVGVTKWCKDVANVDGLPQLGDCWHMDSVDKILALKPTLVIGSVPYKQETVAKLLERPLNFLAMNPRNLEDVYADIELLGGIAKREEGAHRLIRKMKTGFSKIQKRSRDMKRPVRVYCEAWPNPRISSPPWVAELVKICGGEMAVPAGGRISDEAVAAVNPELIVLAWAAVGNRSDPKKTYGVEAWKNVPAIQQRRVVVIRDELLNTPGPPLIAGARELWNAIEGTQSTKSEERTKRRKQ